MLAEDYLKHFLKWMRDSQRASSNSIIAYQQDLTLFLQFFANYRGKEITGHDLADLSYKDVRAWMADENNKVIILVRVDIRKMPQSVHVKDVYPHCGHFIAFWQGFIILRIILLH